MKNSLVLLSLAGAMLAAAAMSLEASTAIGSRLSHAEATQITGGACVDYPATTSCTLDSRCNVINGEEYSDESGNETFDTSYSCGTYQGASCGVFAVSKDCSGE